MASGNAIDKLRSTLGLSDPVSNVRLVSPVRAQALHNMGIDTVRDLILSYPRRYLDMTRVETILTATVGQTCTVVGTVYEVKLKRPKPRLSLTEVTLLDGTGTLIVTAFRQPWLADKLKAGMKIAVAGEVEFNYGFKRMTNPFVEVLEGNGGDYHGRMLPVHPACEKISVTLMRTIMGNALDQYLPVYDPIPVNLRLKYDLMSRTQALQCIHFPASPEEADKAKERLIYEELLLLQVLLMHERQQRDACFVPLQHVVDGPVVNKLRETCPFALTEDQAKAITDIFSRLEAPRRMNHLLLGDVGTGKTLVAAFALAAAADSGTQAVLMAPTEILAQQHMKTLSALLKPLGVRLGLLTSSTPKEDRGPLLEGLATGEVNVLIGTHAVLEPGVVFNRCSLVVIDEQQRFGVSQRQTLLEKAPGADALFLTATPIPRTLALSLYGDLTLSYLKQKPVSGAGRKTHVITWQAKGDAYTCACKALERGEQVYVVCPLVDSATEGEGKKKTSGDAPEEQYAYASVTINSGMDFPEGKPSAAVERRESLANTVFRGYEVGLLHGKLPSAEKQQVMADFAAGRIQVLVATTVIEVGIDVPNATVMLIDSADHFGLSQLHQLRGRVGRGEKPGEVYLISSSTSKTATQRLAAMKNVDDGFELASYDLSLRKEGDVLGSKQHGASLLKLVNVVRDKDWVEAAHADAESIIEADPNLQAPEHGALARELRDLFRGTGAKIGG